MTLSELRLSLHNKHYDHKRWLADFCYFPFFTLPSAGSLWIEMGLDFFDTFTRYRAPVFLQYDLLIPIYGLINFLAAFAVIILNLINTVQLLLNALVHAFGGSEKVIQESLKAAAYNFFGMFVIAPSLLVRGLSQMVAILPLIPRMAARGLTTAWWGWKSLPENEEVQALLEKADKILEKPTSRGSYRAMAVILKDLRKMVEMALKLGQNPGPEVPQTMRALTRTAGPEFTFNYTKMTTVPGPIRDGLRVTRDLVVTHPNANELAKKGGDYLTRVFMPALEAAVSEDDKRKRKNILTIEEVTYAGKVEGEDCSILVKSKLQMTKSVSAEPATPKIPNHFQFIGRCDFQPHHVLKSKGKEDSLDPACIPALNAYLDLYRVR